MIARANTLVQLVAEAGLMMLAVVLIGRRALLGQTAGPVKAAA